jgi:acetyl esterase/lipase
MHYLLAPALLALTSFALAACSSHLHKPAAEPVRAAAALPYSVERDLIYTPSGWPQALKADLYRPQAPGLRAAVLLIHGGGWAAPDRRAQMAGIAEDLAARGYLVLNASYRFAPEHQHPAQLQDMQAAIAWLRSHASRLSIDPARIGAFGYSAGGHLAALLGAVDAKPEHRLHAVVAGGAPTDLRKYAGGSLVPNFLGGSQAQVPQQFADASPVRHVSADDPPVFLYHGGLDTLVPLHHAKDYQEALDAAGVANELLVLRGRGHISAFLADGAARAAALNFLDRHLAAKP